MTYEAKTGLGVTNHYGVRRTNERFGGVYVTEGDIREHVLRIRYNDLPVASDPLKIKEFGITVHGTIISAFFKVRTAFAGGTSYTCGLYKKSDGTAVAATGLFTGTALALANINAVGNVVKGDGTLIEKDLGADEAYVGLAATGTFTAGEAEIIVRYMPAPPAIQSL